MNPDTPDTKIDYEVIVVGAGPAGATAAYYLAKANRKVTVIDRQTFPRDKVCGDFVGPAAVKELQNLGITSLPEFQKTNIINKAAIFLDGKQLITRPFPKLPDEEARVIPRKKLDIWIFEAAKKAGAIILENTLVLGYKVQGDHIEVKIRKGDENKTLKAQLLLAADGTNSIIANQLHGCPPPKTNRIIGVRGYFQNVQGPADQADMHFTSRSFPGYCWLFPISETEANVGFGTLLQTVPENKTGPKELLYQLLSQDNGPKNRLADAQFEGNLQSWPLNTYDPKQQITGDRIMLIGEAAGLVNPLNGEGIQYALQSGRWASQTAIEAIEKNDFSISSLSSYAKRVEEELSYGFRISALIIQLIRNRNLNPLWLKTFEAMISAANNDPNYAETAGGILAGVVPTSEGIDPRFILNTLQHAALTNTVKIADEAIQDPASLPKNVIQITQTSLETAINTAQNPFGFIQWTFDTALSLMEFASATPTILKIQATPPARTEKDSRAAAANKISLT